jgi:hypothetical protein
VRWRVVRDLQFVAKPDGDPRERVTLKAGVVVESIPEGAMRAGDLVAWKAHQARTAREDVAAKPIAVEWLGKVRLLRAPGDVVAAQNARRLPD